MRSTFATAIRRDRLGDFCSTSPELDFILVLVQLVLLASRSARLPPHVFLRERAPAQPSTGRPRPCIVLLTRLTLRRCACAHFCGALETARTKDCRIAACTPASQKKGICAHAALTRLARFRARARRCALSAPEKRPNREKWTSFFLPACSDSPRNHFFRRLNQ